VVSDQPVLLKRGTMEVRGQTLHYDHVKQVLELTGQVRGMLPPKNAAGAPPSEAAPS
jgi:lipopolysaccharide export system protein LptC